MFGIGRIASVVPTHIGRRRMKISAAGASSSPQVAAEYSALNLKNTIDIEEAGGHARIRQHVNPLTAAYMIPAEVPCWPQLFKHSTLPLMLDIGSGSGRFLIWHAKRDPDSRNYLGLEIRQKLVKRAELWVKELSLNNICFLFANATVSFERLVSSYPGPLVFVSILCPDPHFKTKHHKRRVVQTPLVKSILIKLSPGGQVFVQSDVLEVALDMRNQLDSFCSEDGLIDHIDTIEPSIRTDDDGWLLRNPMGIRTEREIHAQDIQGAEIYRRLYQKRQV